MKNLILYSFIVVVIFCSTSIYAQIWTQTPDFPSTERDDGISFTIGNIAYCGTGFTSGFVATKDFYAFDMSSDSWSSTAAMPAGQERQYATGFASSSEGFIFGGIGYGGFLNNLWKYNPISNNWSQQDSLPALGRSGAASFVINNIAFIVGGKTANNDAINEAWSYDIINNTWQQKNNFPFGGRWRASAVTHVGKGYLIFGKDENDQLRNELYEYDPILDSWIQLNSFPGTGRIYTGFESFSEDLVLVFGLDSLNNHYDDMWTYNLASNIWQQQNSLPTAGRKGGMCFSNNSTIYYTTGITQTNTRLTETWKCYNPTNGVGENGWKNESSNFLVYPNPAKVKLSFKFKDYHSNDNHWFKILDVSGKELNSQTIIQGITEIDIADYQSGFYFLEIISETETVRIKFLKN